MVSVLPKYNGLYGMPGHTNIFEIPSQRQVMPCLLKQGSFPSETHS